MAVWALRLTPAGFKGTWRSVGPVRKLYAVFQE